MDNKSTYSLSFLIIGLFAVALALVLLLFNRFHPTKHSTPKRVIYRSVSHQSNQGPSALLQHHLGKQLFLLQQAALRQAMRTADVKHLLKQMLKARSLGVQTRMPLGEDSFQWIASLAQDQAISVIRLLGNTSIADWRDEIMSLRMLSPHEQQRAIKIGRHHNPEFDDRDDVFYA